MYRLKTDLDSIGTYSNIFDKQFGPGLKDYFFR